MGAIALLTVGYFVAIAKLRGGFFAPDFFFVAFNSVAMLGVYLSVDTQDPSQRKYFYLVNAGFLLFTCVAAILRVASPESLSVTTAKARSTPLSTNIWLLYGLTVAICLAYYAAIGRITLIEAVAVGQAGGTYDIATSRLENYSGSTYFYPGYVNQFKNAILPILTAAIIHSLWVRRVPGRLLTTIVLVGTSFVIIAGTGQRGALVAALIVVAAALTVSRALTRSQLLCFFSVGVVAFTFLTVLLQRRAQELGAATTNLDRVRVHIEALWSRLVLENPQSGIAAFQVTERDGIVWGSQWSSELLDLAPGQGSRSLAHRVFESLYGTDRGTAPESIWGGVYYNFGAWGGAAVVVVLACLYAGVGRRLFRVDDKYGAAPPTFLTLLSLSGVAVSLGSWIAGSPATLLNSGLLAYLGVYALERFGLLSSSIAQTGQTTKERV